MSPSSADEGSPVELDGRHGEGGGQLVRTGLSLSSIVQRPLRIHHVRGNRSRPGLAPQHCTAVEAAAAITRAHVEGNRLGSTELTFRPRCRPRCGDYSFDVARWADNGSAGATSLVLQTVLVPLSRAESRSEVQIRGGTHVAWSPPVHYLQDVYGPTLQRLGFQTEINLEAWGFYPAGGGRIHAKVDGLGPDWNPESLRLKQRGGLQNLSGFSAVGNLSPEILERQRLEAERQLDQAGFDVRLREKTPFSKGPGTVVYLRAQYEHATAGFAEYGAKGKPAETVARRAVERFLRHHRSGEPVDPHLADQLVLPLSLAPGQSLFRTSSVTEHLLTNAHVVQTLTEASVDVSAEVGEPGCVGIDGIGNPDGKPASS